MREGIRPDRRLLNSWMSLTLPDSSTWMPHQVSSGASVSQFVELRHPGPPRAS